MQRKSCSSKEISLLNLIENLEVTELKDKGVG